tara:strand:- start:739 stop:1548 length:810 start_codon:yes stop_codon:yes gene_type:complete
MSSWLKKSWPDLNISLLEGGILQVTLNRPDSSNAFSDEMIESLVTMMPLAEADPSVRVYLITGAGKHFCAGGDIKAMNEQTGMFKGPPNELRQRYQQGIQRIPLMMESLSKPIISYVNGAAVGAGCDFACMADLRVASDKAFFAETFAKLGLVPGDGGTYFLPRVIGWPRAMEMFLTGRRVSASEALTWGMVNRVGEFEVALELAKTCLEMAPIALQMTKKALKLSQRAELSQALDQLAAFQGITQRSDDHKEAVQALLEKRPAKFIGQ